MLRSWENRADTFVTDEPLYAYYLKTTGRPHPMAAEVIAHDESDWRKVVAYLTGPIPGGRAIWYQKHMSHHVLQGAGGPGEDLGFLDGLTNCFLLRDPAEMLTSLLKVLPVAAIEETGLPQQVRLFEYVMKRTGEAPPVLDSKDILSEPRQMLTKLCDRLGVAFDESMLQWPAGPRDTDGVWAPAWYANVEKSTGFAPYTPKDEPVPPAFEDVYREAVDLYQHLYAYRIVREESHAPAVQ